MKTILYSIFSYIFWQIFAIATNCHSDGFWVSGNITEDWIMFLGFLIIWFLTNMMMSSDFEESEDKDQ